jgi:hypothetical protein
MMATNAAKSDYILMAAIAFGLLSLETSLAG